MEKKAKTPKFKGTVNAPFKIGEAVYEVGDVFITDSEQNFNLLITQKRIK